MTTLSDIIKAANALSQAAQNLTFTTVDFSWDKPDDVGSFMGNYIGEYCPDQMGSSCIPYVGQNTDMADSVKPYLQQASELSTFLNEYVLPFYTLVSSDLTLITKAGQDWFNNLFNNEKLLLMLEESISLAEFLKLFPSIDLSKPCSCFQMGVQWYAIANFISWDDGNSIRQAFIDAPVMVADATTMFNQIQAAAKQMNIEAPNVKITYITTNNIAIEFTQAFMLAQGDGQGNPCTMQNPSCLPNGMVDAKQVGAFMNDSVKTFCYLMELRQDCVSAASQSWYQENWKKESLSYSGGMYISLYEVCQALAHFDPKYIQGTNCPSMGGIPNLEGAFLVLPQLLPWTAENQYVDSFFSAQTKIVMA